jgi:branched-chain amino acid aminotransferase
VQKKNSESNVDRRVWRNGEFIAWEDATLHVLSHAAQRGSLVFDYVSVHQNPQGAAVFRLGEHLERFYRSCELIDLNLDYPKEVLTQAVLETVRANPGAKAVKLCAYIASVEIDVVPVDDEVHVDIAAYDPVADVLAHKSKPATRRGPTCRLWIEKQIHNRREDIVSPQAKVAANYVSTMGAKARARAAGYDEILLVDEFGQVAETPTANVFIVDQSGAVLTPPVNRVLLGVTRATVLELARASGFETREAAITPDELQAASEVFLTGTTAGVWPVVVVDGEAIGSGEIGPVAKALQERFESVVSGGDDEFAHWLVTV